MDNGVITFKCLFSRSYNYYYYKLFLEKCPYKLTKQINNICYITKRIDISEGIDFNKASYSKEFIICHYG